MAHYTQLSKKFKPSVRIFFVNHFEDMDISICKAIISTIVANSESVNGRANMLKFLYPGFVCSIRSYSKKFVSILYYSFCCFFGEVVQITPCFGCQSNCKRGRISHDAFSVSAHTLLM